MELPSNLPAAMWRWTMAIDEMAYSFVKVAGDLPGEETLYDLMHLPSMELPADLTAVASKLPSMELPSDLAAVEGRRAMVAEETPSSLAEV